VLTVMYMAANFGKKELGLADEVLIPTILIIQLVGVAGSIGFARLSERVGNIRALITSVIIWIGICIGAYFVANAQGFMILAAFVGLVMGGVQALARSTYARLLPATEDHTAYFSFYDVAEKLAVVLGTFLYGLLEWMTGSMRASILLLGVLFMIGLYFFILLRKEKALLPVKK
jgi:MFS transporter, UMF1 family